MCSNMRANNFPLVTNRSILGAATLSALLAAIGAAPRSAPAAETTPVSDRPTTSLPYSPGLDASAMDRSVDPCEDLYAYACGGWQQRNPIPPDQTSWTVYQKLTSDNERYLWGVLDDLARPSATRSPDQQKLGDYFAACMNVDAIEQAGLAPLRADLARLAALADKTALAAIVGDLQSRTWGSRILFASGVEQDAHEATRVIAAIGAGGLGLPDRDYYVRDDAKSAEILQRYQAHIARMLALAGEPEAAGRADAAVILRIETALAKASLTSVERRDPHKTYHRTTLAELEQLAPALDWPAYFAATGLSTEPWLNVTEPSFLREVNARIESESVADLKTYLRWTLIATDAPYLSADLAAESFDFNRRYLLGAEAERPRWLKCVEWADRDLGEALGREYVARTFAPGVKRHVERMTRQIETAMEQRIESLDWMTPATRAQALHKLRAVRNKIGYPDRWRDYSTLIVQRADFFGNLARAASFESHREAAKVGAPVDRDEWDMTPPTVDADYDVSLNTMNFPAGVLMPPLYDAHMDAAPNYGNTGGTIGHELTHAFDDHGRQFDGHGNLHDWWQPTDAKRFEERAGCIRDQYSSYTAVGDVKVNGALTEGENIADLGGELLAWMAWREETTAASIEQRDGLTPEQRFFVGFAQWACGNERPERVRADTIDDPHAPPRYRVNGVVSNMPEFARAFHCKAGQALVRPSSQVCKVW
jgi:endothelin-converting enzyme/putative endopeptidase